MSTTVVCPVCLDRVLSDQGGPYVVWSGYEERYEPADPADMAPERLAELRRRAYILCPNPSDDMERHYLPAGYGDFGTPLIVGLVGEPGAGKSHLLAAMVYEILRGALGRLDVDASPLDLHVHQDFRKRYLDPFVRGQPLPGGEDVRRGYTECLLVTSPTGARPVVLVDVAGGDFEGNRPMEESMRFLGAVDALIFVAAAEYRSSGRGENARPDVNNAFTLAVRGAQAAPRARDVAATVALTKADRIRFVHPVDRWIGGHGVRGSLSPETFAAETEDVYTHLHARGIRSGLTPFEAFTRCTMHFVSATGHDAFDVVTDPAESPEVRPEGVLRPLVAVLAMTGVLAERDARQLG